MRERTARWTNQEEKSGRRAGGEGRGGVSCARRPRRAPEWRRRCNWISFTPAHFFAGAGAEAAATPAPAAAAAGGATPYLPVDLPRLIPTFTSVSS